MGEARVTIPYAGVPTVGCLSASEEGGVVTVTARCTWGLFWMLVKRSLISVCVRTGLISLLIGAFVWSGSSPLCWLGVCGAFAAMVVISGVHVSARLAAARRRPMWEASSSGLRIRVQSSVTVEDRVVPRERVTLVSSGRFRASASGYWYFCGTMAFLQRGEGGVIFFGTRAESEFLAEALSRGLGVVGWRPPEPPQPTPSCAFGTERGVDVSVRPRNLWKIAIWATVVSWTLAVGVALPIVDVWNWGSAIATSLFFSIIGGFILVRVLYRYARGTSLWVDAGGVGVRETGRRPSAVSVPNGDVEGVSLTENGLRIEVLGKPPIDVLANRPKWEREWIADLLRQGLARSRASLPLALRVSPP